MGPNWLAEHSFYGNPLSKWITALAVAVGGYLLLSIVKSVVVYQLRRLAARTVNRIDDLISDLLARQTKSILLMVLAILAATQFLTLPERVDKVITKFALIVVLIQGALWSSGIITAWLSGSLKEKKDKGDTGGVAAFTVLGIMARLALWSMVALVILHNLGINITALVAGLGVGGVAIALAIQNILGDLFASLSITLDKPFVVGDFIAVDAMLGTVERIGLKTTHVRSLSGEQIIFSNTDLLKSRVRNYKRMTRRRVQFTIGVTYQTPHEKLEMIPRIIREIIEGIDLAEFGRAHFKSHGDSALLFEIVYFVNSPDYDTYMDIQQQINLELHRRFAEEGIEFAYPTQTVYVQSVTSPSDS